MLRGAIVGFGEVARYGHWPAYQTSRHLRIVAVVDRSADRRALASSLSREVEAFAAIDELDQALDFIDVCTPPALHVTPMLTAIDRGWHVLCEKPLLLDGLLVDELRRSARDAGVAIVPVHNWKF